MSSPRGRKRLIPIGATALALIGAGAFVALAPSAFAANERVIIGLTNTNDGGRSVTRGSQAQTPTAATRVKELDTALRKYAASVPEFSVAVLNKKTGQRYSFRGGEQYETASIVKVQVLSCLLLTAQNQGRGLSDTELALAKRMIRLSDNAAATALFDKLGKARAVTACNKRLGLTATAVNSHWGLTRTTVDDQVKLLAQLVAGNSPLNAASRRLAFDLMSTVDDAQDWGVPAAARPGETATVKNGWLARSTEGNRWIINSVGRITDSDTDVSIAVLSHGHTSMSGGIKVVEKVAKMTRDHLKY